MKNETKTSNIYPVGSEEGVQRCIEHMARPIYLISNDRLTIFDRYWFGYQFKGKDHEPSYESYKESRFIDIKKPQKLYYREKKANVPYRTQAQAYEHCDRYH